MSILQIDRLTHSFGDRILYQDANLALYKGEHMGVVGQNGVGKSTLLKILLGELAPTGGRIAWQRNIVIGHIDQHAAISKDITILDYLRTAFAPLYALESKLQALYLEMGEDASGRQLRRIAEYQTQLEESGFYAVDSQIARVAGGLGIAAIGLDRQMGTLSGGQRTKAMLAKLLLQNPHVLLLDEPTNFLDTGHIQWLSEYLASFEGSFMIVSHDFAFLDSITNCVCDIEMQTLRKYHGRYTDFIKQKEHLRQTRASEAHAQQREMEKLETYIAKNKVRASTAKMAKSRQKKLDKMQKLAPAAAIQKPAIAFTSLPLTAPHALVASDLLVGYEQPLLPGLSLVIEGGQKAVITGFNGIGKSTLLKTLVGQLSPLGGRYAFAPPVRIGYFEQALAWADGTRTPLELIARDYPSMTPRELRRALARFGVRAEHAGRPIATLSGGEQNKVKLCKLSLQACNFLLLDEPTNHLDAETREALGEAIAAFEGSVLLVCHDSAFYRGFADRVIELQPHARRRSGAETPQKGHKKSRPAGREEGRATSRHGAGPSRAGPVR